MSAVIREVELPRCGRDELCQIRPIIAVCIRALVRGRDSNHFAIVIIGVRLRRFFRQRDLVKPRCVDVVVIRQVDRNRVHGLSRLLRHDKAGGILPAIIAGVKSHILVLPR